MLLGSSGCYKLININLGFYSDGLFSILIFSKSSLQYTFKRSVLKLIPTTRLFRERLDFFSLVLFFLTQNKEN